MAKQYGNRIGSTTSVSIFILHLNDTWMLGKNGEPVAKPDKAQRFTTERSAKAFIAQHELEGAFVVRLVPGIWN